MNQRILVVTGVICLTAGLMIAKPKTGFDGKWVVDSKACQATPPPPDRLTQVIHIHGDDVGVTSTWRESDSGMSPLLYLGLMVSELHLSTDGTPSKVTFGPYTQAARTTLDGSRMTTEWTANSAGSGAAHGEWIRTVSPDGKLMTLKISQTASDGERRVATLVFHRK